MYKREFEMETQLQPSSYSIFTSSINHTKGTHLFICFYNVCQSPQDEPLMRAFKKVLCLTKELICYSSETMQEYSDTGWQWLVADDTWLDRPELKGLQGLHTSTEKTNWVILSKSIIQGVYAIILHLREILPTLKLGIHYNESILIPTAYLPTLNSQKVDSKEAYSKWSFLGSGSGSTPGAA